MLAGFCFAKAQTWTQTSAPSNSWVSVAVSADGTTLAAAAGNIKVNGFYFQVSTGAIYISTNSGVDWMPTTAPITNWTSVAISGDGNVLVASYQNKNQTAEGIYCSTNSGAVWTQVNTTSGWGPAIISSMSKKLITMVPNSSYVLTSTNLGAGWNSHPNSLDQNFNHNTVIPALLTASADGSQVVAALASGNGLPSGTGNMMAITNPPDATAYWFWSQLTNSAQTTWGAIASSSDGSKLFAAANNGYSQNSPMYRSTNSGISWSIAYATNFLTPWDSIASSADGSRILAVQAKLFGSNYSPLFLSVDGGLTWTTTTLPGVFYDESGVFFSSVNMSADGSLMAAAVNGGGIWISRSVLPPQLKAKTRSNNMTFSWVIPSTNFILQQSPDFLTWSYVTNKPSLNFTNLQNQVTLPMSPSNIFFRLATP